MGDIFCGCFLGFGGGFIVVVILDFFYRRQANKQEIKTRGHIINGKIFGGANNTSTNERIYICKETTAVSLSIFKVVFPNSERLKPFLGNC